MRVDSEDGATESEGRLSPEDKTRLAADIVHHGGRVWAWQFRQWVDHVARYASETATGRAAPAPVALFWIGLYGLLVDIKGNVVERIEFLSGLGTPLPAIAAENLAIARELSAAIDAVEALFSADELVYAAYRRHVECHPFQHGFRLRQKNGMLIEHTQVFDRSIPTDEAQAAIRRVLMKHAVREDAIAVEFAARVAPVMPRVQSAAHRYVLQ